MTLRVGMVGQWRAGVALRLAAGTGRKLAALTVAQVAVFAFPVAFAVVCARALGPAQYGVVAFYTALMSYLCVLIEFGLDPIGVRQVNADTRRANAQQVLWNVTLVKLAICLPTSLMTLLGLLVVGSAAGVSITAAVILYLVAYALEPSWYLRSLELMRSVMVVSLVSRLSAIVLLVSIVNTPEDVPHAIWAYTFVAWTSTIVGWLIMRRRGVLGSPHVDMAQLRSLLKSGGAIVVGNLSGFSVVTFGIAVLGMIAEPVVVGAANMALRIRSAAVASYLPVDQMGFVRLSKLVGVDPPAAVEFGRRLFHILMAWSLVLSLVIGLGAEQIAALAYGLPQGPEAAVLMLRLIALGLPASIAGNLFGVQCLTLYRQERAYLLISVAAAVIFFALLFSLQGSVMAYGWALLAADAWVAIAAGLRLRQALNGKRHG